MLLMTNKEASMKQENQIAEFLGWRRVRGSGARMNAPGDIAGDGWLGECKTHITSGHKIHFDSKIWGKICEEAYSKFNQPAYFVDDGSQRLGRTWVMFQMQDLPSNVMTIEYPPAKSISFVSDSQIQDMLNNTTGTKFDRAVYKLRFDNRLVMITDLTTFKEII